MVFYCCFFLAFCFNAVFAQVVITEVSPNPKGASSSLPGDLSHEFIEVYNSGTLPVNLCHYYVKTSSVGSSVEPDSTGLQVFSGDSLRDIGLGETLRYDSLLQPGQFGVILGRKYVSAPENSWYLIPSGTAIFATRKTYIHSGGLSNSASMVFIYSEDHMLISSFNSFSSQTMDPGEGFSWNRIQDDSSDSRLNWSRAVPSPGSIYVPPSSSEGGFKMGINEFMCDPASGGVEWVELCNFGKDSLDIEGWLLKTGDATGFLSLESFKIPPGSFFLCRPQGTIEDPLLAGSGCPIFRIAPWGGLSRNGDEVVLYDATSRPVDSLYYSDTEFRVQKGISMERCSFSLPTTSGGNWKLCTNSQGATPGYKNSSNGESSHFSLQIPNRRLVPGCGRSPVMNFYLDVPTGGQFTLKIFSLEGGLVREFYNKSDQIIPHLQFWNGLGEGARSLSHGVYVVYAEHLKDEQVFAKKIPIVLGGRCCGN